MTICLRRTYSLKCLALILIAIVLLATIPIYGVSLGTRDNAIVFKVTELKELQVYVVAYVLVENPQLIRAIIHSICHSTLTHSFNASIVLNSTTTRLLDKLEVHVRKVHAVMDRIILGNTSKTSFNIDVSLSYKDVEGVIGVNGSLLSRKLANNTSVSSLNFKLALVKGDVEFESIIFSVDEVLRYLFKLLYNASNGLIVLDEVNTRRVLGLRGVVVEGNVRYRVLEPSIVYDLLFSDMGVPVEFFNYFTNTNSTFNFNLTGEDNKITINGLLHTRTCTLDIYGLNAKLLTANISYELIGYNVARLSMSLRLRAVNNSVIDLIGKIGVLLYGLSYVDPDYVNVIISVGGGAELVVPPSIPQPVKFNSTYAEWRGVEVLRYIGLVGLEHRSRSNNTILVAAIAVATVSGIVLYRIVVERKKRRMES